MLLGSGSKIIEVLRSQVPSVDGRVYSVADLAGVQEAVFGQSGLCVTALGYEPVKMVGSTVHWRELWCVTVVVEHHAREERAAATMNEAVEILAEVQTAILGGELCRLGCSPVGLVKGPEPLFTETHGYFPLVFEIATFHR